MSSRFQWITFDVNGLLPPRWQEDVRELAIDADFHKFPKTPVVSREAAHVTHISRGRVHADQVRLRLSWLHELYTHEFLELAREAWTECAVPAHDSRYGLVLNVQRGTSMRFECHVDSNPLTACSSAPITTRVANWSSPTTRAQRPRRDRAGLLDHQAARGTPSLLRRTGAPALREALAVRFRRADSRRYELLHRVISGIDPPQGAEQASLRGRVTSAGSLASSDSFVSREESWLRVRCT